MRKRGIKPEFWTSQGLAACSRDARLTFIGLWNLADDHGVGPANSRIVKAALYPLDDEVTHEEVAALLRELARRDRISMFEAEDHLYYYVLGWDKHQAGEYRRGARQYPDPANYEPLQEAALVLQEAANALPSRARADVDVDIDVDIDIDVGREPQALTRLLVDLLTSRGVKTPGSLKAWHTSADLLLRKDQRPYDQAVAVLMWSQQDEFWHANIHSMPKFREKYDQLREQMVRRPVDRAAQILAESGYTGEGGDDGRQGSTSISGSDSGVLPGAQDR